MARKKIRVGILFGGRSAEHVVSIRSAQSVYRAIDKNKYDVTLLGITQHGSWHVLPQQQVSLPPEVVSKHLTNVERVVQRDKAAFFLPSFFDSIDVVFPVLHGPYGEDGTVQGLLKLMDIPFVGAGVLGSAVGMDKDVMKRLLRDAGLPIGEFLVIKKGNRVDKKIITEKLGLPLFVKPANLGSSVGVSKVNKLEELDDALAEAFQFDTKIIIESFIEGRELEVGVLGNGDPEVSVVGEIKPTHEFYSYEAKYLDENGAELVIPAQIEKKISDEVRMLAKRVFQILEGSDLARVDFFLRKDGRVFVNEINTLPGFTSISMYPKLWEASGLSYADLIDRLLTLARERYNNDRQLLTTYPA